MSMFCSLRLFLLSRSITLLLLCIICCSSSEISTYEKERVMSKESSHFHVMKGSSLLKDALLDCSSTVTSSSTTSMQGAPSDESRMKILHRQHHCSSYHQLNQNEDIPKSDGTILEDYLLQDQKRVNYIQSKISKNENNSKYLPAGRKDSKVSSVPAKSGIPLGIGNYYVTVGFGTPKKDLSLIFDTGSDFTWIQCKPCVVSCHEQEQPIFDPSQSKTYSNITCNSTECTQLRSATSATPKCSSTSNTCIYGIQYGDQSYSVGYFGSEKITLTSRNVFRNFRFGCGQNNRGLFGKTAGLLGLGRNRLSLISQTAKRYDQVFSYCLPSSISSTGYLKLGNDKKDMISSTKFTPLLTNTKDSSFYFLDLTSITVGGTKVAIPPSVFVSSGTIIDSGTVISRLPSSAYAALRSSFRSFMSQYPLTTPTRLLDTCYNLTSYDVVSVPKIILNFRGRVDLDLNFYGLLVGTTEQICLAFAGNQDDTDVAIIGNRQQQNIKVIYNVAGKKLGFIQAGGCSS